MKWKWVVAFLVVFLLGFGTSQALKTSPSIPPTPSPSPLVIISVSPLTIQDTGKAVVSRVIDGDTIELSSGKRVRYIGIDTPETVDPRKPVQCFGREASAENKRLVEGKTVRLEKDVSETDQYGRLLRYVYIGDLMVNDALVRGGFAYESTFPPDIRNQAQFRQAQRDAMENNRGLWSGCSTSPSPATTLVTIPPREDSSTLGTSVASEASGCVIKGNISSSGEKIYHMPGCGSYDKTSIDEGKGEKWFCTENEAQNAGWRKAKNC